MDDPVVTAVRRLRRTLGSKVPIERIVLFGSRARGDARPESDIDLIIVSRAFEGKSLGERAGPLHVAWDAEIGVDFLCYTPQEFEEQSKRVSIVRQALAEGRDIGVA